MAFKKGGVPWNKGKKGVMPVPWNKGLGKDNEKVSVIIAKMQSEIKKQYQNGRQPWNKGLTKSDPRVAKFTEAATRTKKDRFARGELIIWNKEKKGVQRAWNKGKMGFIKSSRKGMTKENCESIRKQALKITGNWEELYGKDRAEVRKGKIRAARLKQIPQRVTGIEKATRALLLKVGCTERNEIGECSTESDFVCQKAVEGICKPDFAFPKIRMIIECDGDYWHGNAAYYKHFDRTQTYVRDKDERQKRLLEEKGWSVFRIWENFIKKHPGCYEAFLRFLVAESGKKGKAYKGRKKY